MFFIFKTFLHIQKQVASEVSAVYYNLKLLDEQDRRSKICKQYIRNLVKQDIGESLKMQNIAGEYVVEKFHTWLHWAKVGVIICLILKKDSFL